MRTRFWLDSLSLFFAKVDDIEDKLDRLIGLYEEDRKRFAQIPFGSPHCPPCTPLAGSPSPPYVNPPGGGTGQVAIPVGHVHQQAVSMPPCSRNLSSS